MLVEVKRAYGGAEGKRVRVGDRFWVLRPGGKKAPEGVQQITQARYQQLLQQRLVGPAEAGAKVEEPSRPRPEPRTRRPAAPVPGAKVEPDSTAPRAPRPRQAAKAKDAEKPKSPRPPRGGQTGEGAPSSSSPAAPQTGGSTLKQRGTRRGQTSGGSSSTTPSGSAPGQTSSTPATPNGGGSTQTPPDDSAAFD